ncbi:unnamed protein product [Eruca vesicaria subsp. sativa]|uniref:Formin-like protein n=1 Tax=Eruca vesicaria subsp. sativa TaxID=29727 RepID=A0ABC8IS35_ERUVS|nr:unnamed protein product [Eruca vesicaria subsp. sativa]
MKGVIIFFLLSYASSHLPCASPVSFTRRHLSQAPLTDPSTSTPTGLPFFPADGLTSPSPPPPPLPTLPMPPPAPLPPSSPTYATFPANISALVLPRSPKPHTASKTLLIPVISAVLAAAIAIGVALFLYGKWRGQNRNFKDDPKSVVASDITTSEQAPCPLPRNTEDKLTVSSSTSNVLYLGNVSTSGFVKPESPEICPLPPLSSRSFQQQSSEEEEEEEDDDFYSPLASIAGKESRKQSNNNNNPYSDNYSSTSDSPTTSPSVNNKRHHHVSSLRMFTLWNQNLGFPRISSASTSPERGGGGGGDAYARSSMYSSVSTTPDRFFFRKVLETSSSPPRWNDFSRSVKSLFLSSASPARDDYCINISESSRNLKSKTELDDTKQSVSVAVPAPEERPQLVMPAPPPIVPPSQSFMVQKSGKKLSWDAGTERLKTKMKPLPWERVRASSSCRKNTWESVKFNSLNGNPKQRSLSCDLPMFNQESRVLDPRKSQSIAFLLTTLDLATKDVCHALRDGQYEALGVELLESLSRVAPSEEEERKLKSYSDDEDSVIKLVPSERFLKELLNVPFVFKRVDALLFVATFESKIEQLKQSFGVIQAACEELRNSRMLLKLIEVVLETGMKSVNAHSFKLEALLDGGTNLLHSVVHNIIESEGIKVLQVVRDLSLALVDVKKTAEMDYGVLRSDVAELYQGFQRVQEVLLLSDEEQECGEFKETVTKFLETAVKETKKIETEDGSTLFAVKEITEIFHGDSTKEEAQLLKVFVIVRDFLSILDIACNEMEVN